MLEAQAEYEFDAPAEKIWALTGNFGGLQAWLPGVVDCRVEGAGAWDEGGNAVRLVQLMDGSVTKEALRSLDAAAYRYAYSILEAKGFDQNGEYLATYSVEPVAGGKSKVIWNAKFTLPAGLPADKSEKAIQRVQNMYLFFLKNLAESLNAEQSAGEQ